MSRSVLRIHFDPRNIIKVIRDELTTPSDLNSVPEESLLQNIQKRREEFNNVMRQDTYTRWGN